MDLYNEAFLQLIESLEAHRVQYLIIGGFAVINYGFSRSTGDLDLYLKDDLNNRNRLVDALEAIGYGRLEPLLRAPMIAGYCEVMMNDGMYADLITEIPGLQQTDFDAHFKEASITEINGITVRFLHYNQLIKNKLATGRPKDLEDVAQLQRIRSLNNHDL